MGKINTTLIFVLLILILSICLFVSYWVWTHYEMYDNDPLVYGARVHDVSLCTCVDSKGIEFSFDQEFVRYKNDRGIKQQDYDNYQNINLSKYFVE